MVFQPGSSRNSRALATDDLFETGRAVLTPPGQARLDEIARWCKYAGNPTSQIVIAAYTDDVRNRDLAEILTQEQADSVRKYLVDKHAVQSAGWFKTRKVAAVGFGTHVPRTLDPSPPGLTLAPRRDHSFHAADLNLLVVSWEGEPPGEPVSAAARTEPRPPGSDPRLRGVGSRSTRRRRI